MTTNIGRFLKNVHCTWNDVRYVNGVFGNSVHYRKNAPKMNHAKKLILKPEKKSRETLLSMRRLQLRILTTFLTGHEIFRAHLHKLGLSTEKLCRFCGIDDESAEHLLCYCN